MNNEIQIELRLLAASAYILWPIGLIIAFSRLKSERFLRFHGYQALALGICGMVLYLMLGLFLQVIPLVGIVLFKALIVLWFGFDAFLAFRCLQGERFRIPILYDLMRGVME